MMSVVTYIRNLMGWSDETPLTRLNFKRDRTDEGLSSDDDTPTIKRPKQLLKTRFPASMASNNTTNGWGKEEKESNVRYVPIQMESRHPSTSTPMESTAKMGARVRTVPIKLVGVRDSASSTPARKPRNNAPIMHAVLDDVDDDEQEVQLVKVKPEVKKKQKVFINLDDYEDELPNDDDVIFVKKVKTPPPSRPYKFFLTDDSQDVPDAEQPIRYRLSRKLNDRSSMSPKPYSKFIAPPGITKSYKKNPTPVSRLWQGSKSTTNFPRNNFLSQNGNTRTTLAEVFNLDEKKNYKELIKRVTESMNPAPFGKRFDSMDLLEEMASFRNTQKAQKKALQDINFIQKGILSDKTNAALKEYDPITVASLNSSDSEVELVPSDTSVSSSVRIDPINTLKDSYRDKAITSKDWLTKLNTKYKKKDLDVREKLKDARRESDIISKVVTEQKLAQLEHKLKYELSIPESLFEEPQPTVELPPLTPEQEKLVNRALGPGPAGQLLVEKFNLRIHRRDLQTLSGLNWLNDEVINFYMNLLMQRSEERKDLPKVYAANTFFYPKLMQNGQAGLRRWTRKVDIFANDLMIVPVHLGVHWCLSIVDFRAKKISYLDSMGGRNQLCLDALLRYLRDEHLDKKGQPFDDNGWTTECLKDIPQQMNGSDCGMFACTFAEFSARNAPYTFSQSHMPYLRRKAALEILSGKLLL